MQQRQQSGRYSAPVLPTTTAPPQNILLSPLMRLAAPRVAAAVMMNGGGGVSTIVNGKNERGSLSKTLAQKTEVPSRPLAPEWEQSQSSRTPYV
jgi:hypothetical protein